MKILYFVLFIHIGLLYFFWNNMDPGKDYKCTVIQRFEPEQLYGRRGRSNGVAYKILVNIQELNQIKTLNVVSEVWALAKAGDVYTFHLGYVVIHNKTDPMYARFLFICLTGFIVLVSIGIGHLTNHLLH